MASILGKVIRRFPFYKSDMFDKKGEVFIMERGLVLETSEYKKDVPSEMINSVKIVRELPFSKYLVNIEYMDYMGQLINMSMIISDEDYRVLSSKIKR
ncbi:MAG: hypothetical protein ACP5H8_01550 [Candidatus Micrarchaeia archaeon]